MLKKDKEFMEKLRKYEDIFFRKEKLDKCLTELSSLFTGENISILPFMRSPFGVYSDECVNDFADKLTEALEICYSFEASYDNVQGFFYLALDEDEFVTMDPEVRTAYRSFFYCALRDIYDNTFGAFEKLKYDQTLASITEAAKRFEQYNDFESLLKGMYSRLYSGGLIGISDNLLVRLSSIYSSSECNPCPYEFSNSLKRFLPITDEEEIKAQGANCSDNLGFSDVEDLNEEEYFADEDEEAIYDDEFWGLKKREKFMNFDSFEEQFKTFIHYQHYLPRKERFVKMINGAVNVLLVENKVSLLNENKDFYDTLSILKISQRKIASEIKKRNRL